ncbi:MAG TPA: hypothetical protein VKB47_17460 [Terracidiphilus sp.]|nr:hypothetical protein [Terracidiphilus sp.]
MNGKTMFDLVYFLCLWFSLPLAVWLQGARIGLALHWQVVSARPARRTIHPLNISER